MCTATFVKYRLHFLRGPTWFEVVTGPHAMLRIHHNMKTPHFSIYLVSVNHIHRHEHHTQKQYIYVQCKNSKKSKGKEDTLCNVRFQLSSLYFMSL